MNERVGKKLQLVQRRAPRTTYMHMDVGNDAEIDFKYMARPAYSPGDRGQRVSVDFPRDTIHLQSEEWKSPALVLVAYNAQSWQMAGGPWQAQSPAGPGRRAHGDSAELCTEDTQSSVPF